MKKYLAALMMALGILSWHGQVEAACTTTVTVLDGGQLAFCTTCCTAGSFCTTSCQ